MLDRIFTLLSNFNCILHVLDSFQTGSVILQHGKHAVEVETRKVPLDVWISLKNSSGIQVCNGDIDKVSYTITPTGFALYVDVASETLQIEWQALFKVEE